MHRRNVSGIAPGITRMEDFAGTTGEDHVRWLDHRHSQSYRSLGCARHSQSYRRVDARGIRKAIAPVVAGGSRKAEAIQQGKGRL